MEVDPAPTVEEVGPTTTTLAPEVEADEGEGEGEGEDDGSIQHLPAFQQQQVMNDVKGGANTRLAAMSPTVLAALFFLALLMCPDVYWY